MTSIILTQKLLTMQLDKTEFERIKRQQADVSREKHKMVNVLKVILDRQLDNKTCRLCLKPGGREIFNGGQDFDVALNIRYILGIEITENDGKPQHICEPCELTVHQASRLKQTAEATQWRLQQEQDMVASFPDWSADGDSSVTVRDADVAREWPCGNCRRTFRSQGKFREHKRSCRDKPCFICESCGLALKNISRLKTHRITHTGQFPHACSSCPYRARSAGALAAHARRHAGLRPRRCARCPAAFPSASALASHGRTHAPPRHPCPSCARAFKFRAALRNHIASQHSGVKPFGCNFCEKVFSTRKMMLRHELKAHNRPKMRTGVMPCYLRQEADT